MPRKKKRNLTRRRNKESSVIVYYKFIIYVFLVAVLGTFFFKLISPVISNTAEVLGISAFLARGGDNGDSSGSGGGNSVDSRSSGDDSDSGDSSGSSTSGGSGDNTSESSGRGGPKSRVDIKIRNVEPVETASTESSGGATLESGRLRIRIKDGRARIDLKTDEVHAKLDIRDDRIVIKVNQKDGSEVELDESEALARLQERLALSGINIATEGGNFVFSKRHIGARTHFPLSIDLATNTLIVTTPAGTKAVAVLPDKAVQNMLTKGILSKIGGGIASGSGDLDDDEDDATESGEIGETPEGTEGADLEDVEDTEDDVELTEENGILVYKIKGVSNQKFFGVIPVTFNRTAVVSALTGDLESTEESLFARFLDLFSF